jgi:aarF domain-containing kinase
MKDKDIDLKDVSKVISEAFNHMIYEKGFVHGDPHPGNMMARVNKDGELQIVILDHGVYTTLKPKSRLAYTKLWRGILV